MEQLQKLLWSRSEYENSFHDALASPKGQGLLQQTGGLSQFFSGTLIRLRTDPASDAYGAIYVHSLVSNAGGQLQVVKVLGLSKNSGSRVSRRIPDLSQLQGVQHSPEGDASVIQQAQQSAQQLGLTEHELKSACLRMQMLRVLCDYCEAAENLEQLHQGDVEYLDAQDDLDNFDQLLQQLLQQHTALSQQQQPPTAPAGATPLPTAATAPALQLPLAGQVAGMFAAPAAALPTQPASFAGEITATAPDAAMIGSSLHPNLLPAAPVMVATSSNAAEGLPASALTAAVQSPNATAAAAVLPGSSVPHMHMSQPIQQQQQRLQGLMRYPAEQLSSGFHQQAQLFTASPRAANLAATHQLPTDVLTAGAAAQGTVGLARPPARWQLLAPATPLPPPTASHAGAPPDRGSPAAPPPAAAAPGSSTEVTWRHAAALAGPVASPAVAAVKQALDWQHERQEHQLYAHDASHTSQAEYDHTATTTPRARGKGRSVWDRLGEQNIHRSRSRSRDRPTTDRVRGRSLSREREYSQHTPRSMQYDGGSLYGMDSRTERLGKTGSRHSPAPGSVREESRGYKETTSKTPQSKKTVPLAAAMGDRGRSSPQPVYPPGMDHPYSMGRKGPGRGKGVPAMAASPRGMQPGSTVLPGCGAGSSRRYSSRSRSRSRSRAIWSPEAASERYDDCYDNPSRGRTPAEHGLLGAELTHDEQWLPHGPSDSSGKGRDAAYRQPHAYDMQRQQRRSRSASKGQDPGLGDWYDRQWGRQQQQQHQRAYSDGRERSSSRGRSRERRSRSVAASAEQNEREGGHARSGRAARLASPAQQPDDDLHTLLRKLRVEGLSQKEVDELRSLALLHSFAEAVRKQPGGCLTNKKGERIELELACEPKNIVEAVVEIEQLQLPSKLAPSDCSVPHWVRSSACVLLEPAGTGVVKVTPRYMFEIRRHSLLRRLTAELQEHLLQKHGSGKVFLLRDVWEPASKQRAFMPLQLYRLLYKSIVNFIADNLAGGPLGVMLHDTMFRLVPPDQVDSLKDKLKSTPVKYRLPNHPAVTRNARLDSGYIVPIHQLTGSPVRAATTPRPAAAAAGMDAAGAAGRLQRKGSRQRESDQAAAAAAGATMADRWSPQDSDSDKEHHNRQCSRSRGRSRDLSLSPARGTARKRLKDDGRSISRSANRDPSPGAAQRGTTGMPKHPRIPIPVPAAAAAAEPDSQAGKASPWSRLDLSGLRNEERDELRSLALLHCFVEAVGRASTSQDKQQQLEAACEPKDVVEASVSVEELSLPANMQPSNCSVARFVRSYRCGLLVKAKEKDKAWVVPHYMSVVHQHRLLRRLLQQLMSHLRAKNHGLTRIYFFRDMEDLITRVAFYQPLLMYRELYRSTKAFVADCIYLAGEVLMHDKGLVLVPESAANEGSWTNLEHVPYTLPAHKDATRDLALTGPGSPTAAAIAAAAAATAAADGQRAGDDTSTHTQDTAAAAAAGKVAAVGAVADVVPNLETVARTGGGKAAHHNSRGGSAGIRKTQQQVRAKPQAAADKGKTAAASADNSQQRETVASTKTSSSTGSKKRKSSSKPLMKQEEVVHSDGKEAQPAIGSKDVACSESTKRTAAKRQRTGSEGEDAGGNHDQGADANNTASAATAGANVHDEAEVSAIVRAVVQAAVKAVQQQQDQAATQERTGAAASTGNGAVQLPPGLQQLPPGLQQLLGQLDLSGLSGEQQDEVRSVALLHVLAAAIAAAPGRAQQQPPQLQQQQQQQLRFGDFQGGPGDVQLPQTQAAVVGGDAVISSLWPDTGPYTAPDSLQNVQLEPRGEATNPVGARLGHGSGPDSLTLPQDQQHNAERAAAATRLGPDSGPDSSKLGQDQQQVAKATHNPARLGRDSGPDSSRLVQDGQKIVKEVPGRARLGPDSGPDGGPDSSRLEAELAHEPVGIFSPVPLRWLQLPPSLMPADCSLGEFVASKRCPLLELLPGGYVQVRKGYMRLIRQQAMVSPQGLMGDLLTQLEVTQLDDTAPTPLANVEEVLCSCYRPLLLYRLLYTTVVDFAADMISGGSVWLMQKQETNDKGSPASGYFLAPATELDKYKEEGCTLVAYHQAGMEASYHCA